MIKQFEVLKNVPHYYVMDVLGRVRNGLLKAIIFDVNNNKRLTVTLDENKLESEPICDSLKFIYNELALENFMKETDDTTIRKLNEMNFPNILIGLNPINLLRVEYLNKDSLKLGEYIISFSYLNGRIKQISAIKAIPILQIDAERYIEAMNNECKTQEIMHCLLQKYQSSDISLVGIKKLHKHSKVTDTSTMVKSDDAIIYQHKLDVYFKEALQMTNKIDYNRLSIALNSMVNCYRKKNRKSKKRKTG